MILRHAKKIGVAGQPDDQGQDLSQEIEADDPVSRVVEWTSIPSGLIRNGHEQRPRPEVAALNDRGDANEAEQRQWRQKEEGGVVPKRKPYFLTVDQIATRWNVSARTVWRMVKDGRLPSRLIGSSRRVLEADVEQFEAADMAVA